MKYHDLFAEHQFYLALPSAKSGRRQPSAAAASATQEHRFADERAMIRSLQIMSRVMGFQKSFSTNDILGIDRQVQLKIKTTASHEYSCDN